MMQATEKQKKNLWQIAIDHFPKGHVLLIAGLAAGLGAVALVPSERASANRQSQALELPEIVEIPLAESLPEAHDEYYYRAEPPKTDVRTVSETVRSGDSLSTIFHRAGLSDRAMLELVNSSETGKKLSRLYPGHELVFTIDADGKLQTLKYIKDRLNSHVFTRDGDGFVDREEVKKPDVQMALRHATIDGSLYAAGLNAQLDDRLIMELARIFGWDIDFALDLRQGDSFKVLFEERFLDGEKIGNGRILAAEFVNQGDTFRAVRYEKPDGEVQYYTPTGKSMRKAFLRAPLDFRRISSNFNPNRLHPVFKTKRPHRGTDYAANTGTPVWASGSGRVIEAGYTRANGNYVFIQHGNNVVTKYLHLHKRYVKTGERVKQREAIGTVGATGYATGPHLHYEFLLDGVHRNPRTILDKLPKAESIAQDEMQRFYSQTQPLLAELDQEPATRYASAERDNAIQSL